MKERILLKDYRKIKYLLVLSYLSLSCFLADANVINVPANAATIQGAINLASSGDTILVQPGTYMENLHFKSADIVLASLFLTIQDTSYISQTIIDGNQTDRVMLIDSGQTANTLVSGFTITHGNASNHSGGGIYCINSSPRLEYLKVVNNQAHIGAGIFFRNSNARLSHSNISNNTANFAYNSYGGGIICYTSNCQIRNVVISNNYSKYTGGIEFKVNSNGLLENVLVNNNSAAINAGGISINGHSNPILKNVTVADNSAGSAGAGFHIYDGSYPILINTIVWNNSPDEITSYSALDFSTFTFIHCDIEGGQNGINTMGNASVNWLGGNISQDPLFELGQYTLQIGSPCIDAGINDSVSLSTDLVGNARIMDGDGDGVAVIDMGPLEVQHGGCLFPIYDTTNITVYDTMLATIYDTSLVTVYDTMPVFDTTFLTRYDTVIINHIDTTTLTVHDTIAVTDTLIIDIPTRLNAPNDINIIKVYPNPTTNLVIIDNGNYSLMPNYRLKIINAAGQQIFDSPINVPFFTVDLSHFGGAGMYFIQILNPSNQIVREKKIVLQ